MTSSSKKTLIWGGGSCLRLMELYLGPLGRKADFVFSDPANPAQVNQLMPNLRPDICHAAEQCDAYAIFIGGEHGKRRSELSELFQYHYGLAPISLIHPTAYICKTANYIDPIFLMPGSIIHSFASIDRDCIINTSAVVEHECNIGRGVHIMGSAVVTGRVQIGQYATIGSNASILPDIEIGDASFVGAGAVVTRDVSPGQVVVGIPAKPM